MRDQSPLDLQAQTEAEFSQIRPCPGASRAGNLSGTWSQRAPGGTKKGRQEREGTGAGALWADDCMSNGRSIRGIFTRTRALGLSHSKVKEASTLVPGLHLSLALT